MKAFRIIGTGKGELTEVPKPEAGNGEVLLRVDKVALCGSDLNTWRGANPMVSLPRIPGHEIGAEIVALGIDVETSWLGAKVAVAPYTNCGKCHACQVGRYNCCRNNETMGVQRDGALCEFIVVPTKKLYRSEILSYRELALVEPLTVGAHAVDRTRVEAGEVIAVLGCGAVGLGAIALAAEKGARVVAVDIDDAKLELAKDFGAEDVVNSLKVDLKSALLDMTQGEGPAAVVEAIGLPETFLLAVDVAAFAGRVVYIGYAKRNVEYETKDFVRKELDIMGSRNASPGNFREVVEMLEKRAVPVEKMISAEYGIDQLEIALNDWDARPSRITRIVIDMD